MPQSSASALGWEMAQEFSAAQPITGETVLFHQDAESQSTIRSKADHFNLARAPAQLTRLAEFPSLIAVSHATRDLITNIEHARDSLAPMLITGETGTGKEMISRAVHAISVRHERELIVFDCAAVNSGLIESELFGHRRGSFTGADRDFKGVIRTAETGTLFLDEIGEIPLEAQAKLLRFLQEGEVRPAGEARPIKTNVRVIAATNRDLEADVRSGRFRADLFERLNVLRFHILPLRERREDIPPLIAHFFDHYQRQERKQGLRLSEEALALLLDYDWPRNVRQLANEIYRLVVLSGSDEVIGPERLSPEIRVKTSAQPAPLVAIVEGKAMIDLSLPYHEARDEMERQYIINALKEASGNQQQAAAKMRMSRGGFKKAIKKFGIEAEKYRQLRARD
jgi:DNA-binding NtrC family response regulator